jgi:iron only hydrogenase large subunit-like protein
MEAAVRSVYERVTGSSLPKLELDQVRGLEGAREADISRGDTAVEGLLASLRVAVVTGLGSAKTLIQSMKDGEAHYDFVAVMACPGGCIAEGGNPRGDKEAVNCETGSDLLPRPITSKTKSHENPSITSFF